MNYLTGAHPDRETSRDRDAIDFNFAKTTSDLIAAYASEADFVQPIRWIRSQPRFPNCVGQTIAACVDAKLPDPLESAHPTVLASGVSIWREARRRQGLIEVIELGTRLEYAIEGLITRGWDPYRDGEDLDEEEAGKGAPLAGDDLADEMAAYDNRLARDIKRYRIIGFGGGMLDEVDEALRRGLGVGIGTGLLAPFFSHRSSPGQSDQVLGVDYMGGHKDNHAQRVAGRGTYDGRRKYLVQNSWGDDWSGCHAPDGNWLPGCVWVDEDVIVGAHDVHVVEVRS